MWNLGALGGIPGVFPSVTQSVCCAFLHYRNQSKPKACFDVTLYSSVLSKDFLSAGPSLTPEGPTGDTAEPKGLLHTQRERAEAMVYLSFRIPLADPLRSLGFVANWKGEREKA